MLLSSGVILQASWTTPTSQEVIFATWQSPPLSSAPYLLSFDDILFPFLRSASSLAIR